MSESESLLCPNCSERSPGGYILCPYCGFDLTKIVRERERVRVTFREKFSRIFRSLVDPRESKRLFNEIGVNPDRLGAILVLYFLSVGYGLRVSALFAKGANPSWHGWDFMFFFIAPWFVAIGFIILAIFGWFICSLIIWLIAKTLGGKASFRDTQGIVGYSLGPLIPASVIINVIITFIGPGLGTITTTTYTNYTIFELLYIPFLVLTAYHCGNGIRTAHLLNEYYSYGIAGGLTLVYTLLFLIPNIL
ncbi:MAG: YIP1 family protein [Candidatus Heimdallarchaeota archaeon]|nr:MAG: YIP1 family protein [Candidatus Heimdallarchaeota archaeon]